MLAARIKEARKALGLTQKELSSKLGVTLNAANAWEAGRSTPGGKPLMKLVELGIDGHWLLSGEGNKFGDVGDAASITSPTPMETEYQDVIEQLKSFGLLNVFLNSKSDQVIEQKWKLMSVLLNEDHGLTLEEIEASLGETEPQLESCLSNLRDLEMRGIAQLENGKWDLIGNPSLRVHSGREHSETAKELLSGLGQKVIPGILRNDKTGGIAIFEGSIMHGDKTFLEIREQLKKTLNLRDSPKGNKVAYYLAFGSDQ